MSDKVRQEFLVERHAVTRFVLYEVTGEDLEQLEKETLTVGEDFSFALTALAIAASFTITLSTVTIPAGKTFEVFWVVVVIGYISALYFGIRWLRGRRQSKSVIKKIRERGGPLGEEGKEVADRIVDVTSTSTLAPGTKKT